MATELSPQALMRLSADWPHKYCHVAAMIPLWRPFLLDEPEQARLSLIEANHSGSGTGRTYYKFLAQITGISEAEIDSFYIAGDGDDGIVTVVPHITTQDLLEFLETKG